MPTQVSKNTDYIPVIGLEVHAQLSVLSKMFAPESATYGALPNTLVSTISLAHPGTLPSINKKAIDYAIKFGLACKSTINRKNYFARKNYFYGDLPKGYQISQDRGPICQGGYITITDLGGKEKQVFLQRAHLEEDAGKSIHDLAPRLTLLDFNRAGVALLEIVTQPVLQSSQEAYTFLTELRRLVRYLDICDGNMEEGSLRCDVNISVMPVGASVWGQRVEVKNINSIKNVQLAIEYEIGRQVELLNSGEKIQSETRSYDALGGKTISQRTKETALDYRYFIEPDLPLLEIGDSWIEDISHTMPLLPAEYHYKFTSLYKVSAYAASVITESKESAHFFEALCQHTPYYIAAANWLMGPIKAYLNEKGLAMADFPIDGSNLSRLIQLVEEGKVSFSAASQQLFPKLLQQPRQDPYEVAQQLNLFQETDQETLQSLIDDVLAAYPDKVLSYKKGKTGILGMLMGEIMKKSQRKAAPALVNKLLKEKLDNVTG
jgi:aspartyl-tRNA(Asn)/glutamyl-tRNA(Gln) amidotransferase subunit B